MARSNAARHFTPPSLWTSGGSLILHSWTGGRGSRRSISMPCRPPARRCRALVQAPHLAAPYIGLATVDALTQDDAVGHSTRVTLRQRVDGRQADVRRGKMRRLDKRPGKRLAAGGKASRSSVSTHARPSRMQDEAPAARPQTRRSEVPGRVRPAP